MAGGLLDVDDCVLGQVDEAALACHRDVLQHRTPDERDLAAVRDRGLRDLLHAVEVRREARDDEALVAVLPEQCAHRRADGRLRRRESRTLGVRRVREQHADAAVAPGELAQQREVGMAAVDRREVELEVAGVDDRALGREVRDRESLGDRVRHRDELALDRPDAEAFAVGDGDELGAVEHARFLDAVPRERERERGAVDRHRDVAQQEGEAAGVVLVGVGEDHRLDPIGVLAQVREVGQDEIDAGHVGVGEHDPAVDDQDPAVDLEAEAVPADLAEPAEENDPDRHQPVTLPRRAPTARLPPHGGRRHRHARRRCFAPARTRHPLFVVVPPVVPPGVPPMVPPAEPRAIHAPPSRDVALSRRRNYFAARAPK